MLDQASTLRHMSRYLHGTSEQPSAKHQPVAIAITSGKGGVGKTNVVANLAVSLANMGKKVVVLDADFGLANMDVLLGLTPRRNIRDVILGTLDLEDIIVDGPSGVRIIPASSGVEQMASLTIEQQSRLIRSLWRLGSQTDYLLIDTAAGITKNVIHFLLAAGLVMVVTTPEPTAIVDAYLMVKILAKREPQKRISILVNSVTGRSEALHVYEQIDMVSRRFLSRPLELLGFIEKDRNVAEAVRHQSAFVNMFPGSIASRRVNVLAKKVHTHCDEIRSLGKPGVSWNSLFETTRQS
jgi:flagellar biosynthesis protein FlhG